MRTQLRGRLVLALLLGLVAATLVAPPPATAVDPGFRLPFTAGGRFQISQGPAEHAAGAYPDYNRHAIDFAMPTGTAVLASAGGSVQFEGYDSTGAIQVRIDHGSDRCTQYVHLSSTVVDRGQSVLRGQLIGYSGSTGISSGPHLHFNMVFCSTHRSRDVVNTLEMGTRYPVGSSAASRNSSKAATTPHWESVTGRLVQLDLGPQGQLWGINATGDIFQYAGSGRWTKRGTGFKHVTVGHVPDAATGGPVVYATKTNNTIVRWRTNRWEGVAGRLVKLDLGPQGQLWGINATGEIFQYAGSGRWTKRGTGFKHVTVGHVPDAATGGPVVYATKTNNTIVRWRT